MYEYGGSDIVRQEPYGGQVDADYNGRGLIGGGVRRTYAAVDGIGSGVDIDKYKLPLIGLGLAIAAGIISRKSFKNGLLRKDVEALKKEIGELRMPRQLAAASNAGGAVG